IGDFHCDLFGARPRVWTNDQRLFDRELGVLESAQIQISNEPAHDGHRHGDEHHSVVFDRKDTWVHDEPPPSALPRSRTFWPSRSWVTPATTMRSPGCSPSTISIRPPVTAPTFTGRGLTVSAGPTTQTTGPSAPAGVMTAETGTRSWLPKMLAR